MKLAIVAAALAGAALLATPVHAQIELKKQPAKEAEPQKKANIGKSLRKKEEAKKGQEKKRELGKNLRKKQEAQKK